MSDTSNVRSTDGTRIATYRAGAGPVIVLVDAALSTHDQSARLSALLEQRFTVVRYDRRGRGGSDDATPEAADPSLEVADIAAVIAANGGSAVLFGSSSGAALALEAASRLGKSVTGLALYEPPFILDGSRSPIAVDLAERIRRAVADGDRSRAISLFMREAMGIPAPALAIMRILPAWRASMRLAHTLSYDFAVLGDTQRGTPLGDRWAGVPVPGFVMVGSRSEPFFHTAARQVANQLAGIDYRQLEGGHHGSAVMSPAGIAEAVIAEFAR